MVADEVGQGSCPWKKLNAAEGCKRFWFSWLDTQSTWVGLQSSNLIHVLKKQSKISQIYPYLPCQHTRVLQSTFKGRKRAGNKQETVPV
jgi:hypothetical protein